ncbi:polysaccharide pyruvyl transferase family protein [Brachybacterium sp. GCM10030267]|uniref:polysaccharide pyruvyl transferase family protein n=1 Tax=Brachybacterium sp. GCM10030267 TaxID=3273381 RepID=UPI00361BD7FB
MKVAVLCDVDQTVYHVGDEAIATMTSRRLAARGFDVVRISRHEKYGPDGTAPASAIPALTFPWPLEDRARYLEEIRAVLAGELDALPAEDKLFGIIERLRAVDALVIGGGGSLTSRYGWLLDERVATAEVAHSLGKPVILSGQSLGPELTDTDRDSVRRLLELCSVVGLRDHHSVGIARRLCPGHPAVVQTLDDAVGLEPETPLDPELISVTLGGDGDPFPRADYVAVAAAVIEELARRTGARVELVPHMADPDTGGGDLQVHREVADLLTVPATVCPIEPDTAATARTARAAWVVTTRFHPVVFGAAAGASVLAMPLNRYGASRMDGALRNLGLAGGVVPLAALWDPVGAGPSDLVGSVVDALVAARESERAHLEAVRPALLQAAADWWDTVASVLRAQDGSAGRGSAPAVEASSMPAVADPAGAGIEPHQRWPHELREELAPWMTTTGTPAPEPSVSIIMRTRDRARMLDRALQDVLAQTRQDWELVIVNDAGDRRGVDEAVARYEAESGGRIRVLHRERSTGMEAASNHGLRESTAPVVSVHDDDDTWHATFLQETLAHLAAHPEQDAVVVRTLVVYEHETPSGFVEDEAFRSWPELEGARLLDYIAVNRHAPIAILHRRRVHESVGEFDESLPVVGDYAFHLELLQRFDVGFLDRPLAQWRHRPTATGPSSNSMFSLSHGHRHFDAELRERYFREWTREHGIGLPMFLSKNTETLLGRSEERVLEELRAVREELGATRAELAELREERAGAELTGTGGRAVRAAGRLGRRALDDARRALGDGRRALRRRPPG